jgi:membrane complex biogenesis BtpA family protein
MLRGIFGRDKPIIGVAHLLPLPGSPRFGGGMREILERARADAEALRSGGADGVIVENFGDAPFLPAGVAPETIAAMALVAAEVAASMPTGVNVLRNDARAALGIAAATGARFIRVNVHTGVMATDQGIIEGRAYETLRARRALSAEVAIFADVLVKHGGSLAEQDLARAAEDAVRRGLADALIVTGTATGVPPKAGDVSAVKLAAPQVPVLVGSGVDEGGAAAFLAAADGLIVGSSLEKDGVAGNPVEVERVRRLVRAARG